MSRVFFRNVRSGPAEMFKILLIINYNICWPNNDLKYLYNVLHWAFLWFRFKIILLFRCCGRACNSFFFLYTCIFLLWQLGVANFSPYVNILNRILWASVKGNHIFFLYKWDHMISVTIFAHFISDLEIVQNLYVWHISHSFYAAVFLGLYF